MSDDRIFKIISELYEFESSIRSNYMIRYVIAAYERDIKNVDNFEELDLKHLPSRTIINQEKAEEKKKKADQIKAKKKNKKNKKEADPSNANADSDSDTELNKLHPSRPESLFYRLFKLILNKDPATKQFIYLVSIYIINRVMSHKTIPDSDEQHYMAFDIQFESETSQKIAQANEAHLDGYLEKRKNDLLEFVTQFFDKLVNDILDIDDSKQRRFELKIFNGKDEEPLDQAKDEALYVPTLPPEMQYFLFKAMETMKRQYINESRYFLMHSKLLELVFCHISDVIENYQMHLLPYVKRMDFLKKLKDEMSKFHIYNFRNACEVILSYISHRDAFPDREIQSSIFDELNVELKRESRNTIETVFKSLVLGVETYRPEFACFQNLIAHSYEHEGIHMNLAIENFLKVHEVFLDNDVFIFGRKEPVFDFLYNKLITFEPKELKYLKLKWTGKGPLSKVQIKLQTQVFTENFDDVRKWEYWCACLTSKYSYPIHKHLINQYVPSDPTSIHEAYCQLFRIPEINLAGYDDLQSFLIDANSHNVDSTKASLEILRLKDRINSEIKKEWQRKDHGNDMNEAEFAERHHAHNYTLIEEEIKLRNSHLYYLLGLYYQLRNLSSETERFKNTVKKQELEAYETVLANYQFGLANQELKNFSSINTSLKYMRRLFSKSNSAMVSKELFENLTNDQKRELKSFHKLRFMKLLNNKTIVKYHMPQLKTIIPNLRIVFFEDESYNVQVQVIFKDRPKTAVCGRAIMKTKTSIILKFTIAQEEVLQLMKTHPDKTDIFGEVLEFNIGKLVKIINQLFRARSINK